MGAMSASGHPEFLLFVLASAVYLAALLLCALISSVRKVLSTFQTG